MSGGRILMISTAISDKVPDDEVPLILLYENPVDNTSFPKLPYFFKPHLYFFKIISVFL